MAESWYARNRDHCLDLAKKYREANLEKIRNYQAEYYQRRKANRPPPPPKPPKPVPDAPVGFVRFPKNPKIESIKGLRKRGARPPKATYEFTPKEDETGGWLLKAHQRDKLLAICHKGFLEEAPKENPFHVSFD